jgi:hypothetical protein
MRKSVSRGIAAAALTAAAGLLLPLPALAATTSGNNPPQPNIVDDPNTSNLHNEFTFAPLGVPVFGLVEAALAAPNGIVPTALFPNGVVPSQVTKIPGQLANGGN